MQYKSNGILCQSKVTVINMQSSTLIAMSGGVDSAVAAYLIKTSVGSAAGATMKLSDAGANEAVSAAETARRLGIEHYVFDFSAEFSREVVDRFCSTYLNGATPNPCIYCNRKIKFGRFLERALELGYDKVATGHYAQIEYDRESGRYILLRALDRAKDQTYVLSVLNQYQLSKTLLPLGSMTKPQVRALAAELGLGAAERPESQDICFIPDHDHARFIREHTGKIPPRGKFIDTDGNVLGEHSGIINYTIGQRKGLGVSVGRPIYVCRIDAADNRVVLGGEDCLYEKRLYANELNFVALGSLAGSMRVTAKIRYSHKEVPAVITMASEHELCVEFDSPQRAITCGQTVVLYSDDAVVASGTICRVGGGGDAPAGGCQG